MVNGQEFTYYPLCGVLMVLIDTNGITYTVFHFCGGWNNKQSLSTREHQGVSANNWTVFHLLDTTILVGQLTS